MPYLQMMNGPLEAGGKIIERKALEKLDARHKVIYIHAPAGYGKTMLAASWVRSLKHNAAWLDLGKADQALSAAFECNQTVVLDNFSTTEHSEEIEHLLKEFSGKLVIISRIMPPAWLYDLIIKHAASIINEDDLRFTQEEARELFSIYGRMLPCFAVDAVCEHTGGWPSLIMAVMLFGEGLDAFTLENMNYYCGKFFIGRIHRFWNGAVKRFLLKTSLPDYIDKDYCEAVAGMSDGMDILERLSKETGFLLQNRNGLYYHPVFRRFLRLELIKSKMLYKGELCEKAAAFLMEGDSLHTALEISIESEDAATLEKTLLALRGLRRANIGIGELNGLVRSIGSMIPEKAIEGRPLLSRKLKLLRFIVSEHEISYHSHMHLIIDELGFALFFLGLTHNLPFLHRARHDFSELLPIIKSPESITELFCGIRCPALEKLLICGLLYEKYDISSAGDVMAELEPLIEYELPELVFCSGILKCEILLSLGKEQFAFETLKSIETVFAGNPSLMTNFQAYKTKIALYRQDSDASSIWLENYAYDQTSPLKLHQLFQNLTTVRALIIAAKLSDAAKLLDRLLEFAKKLGRVADTVEILTLKAACDWYSDKKRAVHSLEEAVITASKIGLVNPIIAESADILPVLEYLLNRIRLAYCEKELDRNFLQRLYILSLEASKNNKGLFFNTPKKPVKLSKRQQTVLVLLAEGLEYEQIATRMNVKITTVRDHISKLYENLGVNSSKEALVRGREAKLI